MNEVLDSKTLESHHKDIKRKAVNFGQFVRSHLVFLFLVVKTKTVTFRGASSST